MITTHARRFEFFFSRFVAKHTVIMHRITFFFCFWPDSPGNQSQTDESLGLRNSFFQSNGRYLYKNMTLNWVSRRVRLRSIIMAILFACASRPTGFFHVLRCVNAESGPYIKFGTGILHRLLLLLLLLLVLGPTRRPAVEEKAWERGLIGEFIYVAVALLNFASFGRSGYEHFIILNFGNTY